MRTRGSQKSTKIPAGTSAVPDVLGPDLDVVFCGINPGRFSAEAAAHFANPRNDFWRLLNEAGFTPRLLEPGEQFELLDLGIGVTNAALRTTKGSSDLRSGDFAESQARLERIALDLRPRAIAFVGKEAYRGTFGERPDLGPQVRTIDDVALFVLPSTSPANAAVPYAERLRWFKALRDWLEPVDRVGARALILDEEGRTLLVQFRDGGGQTWWAMPGGGIEEGEDVETALRRELAEEVGLDDFELGPEIWTREHTFGWRGRILLSVSGSGSSRFTSTRQRRASIWPPSSSRTSVGGRGKSSPRPRRRSCHVSYRIYSTSCAPTALGPSLSTSASNPASAEASLAMLPRGCAGSAGAAGLSTNRASG